MKNAVLPYSHMSILSQVQAVVSDLQPHTIALFCVLFVGPLVFLRLVSAFFGLPAGYMILDYLGLGWLWGDGESRGDRKGSGKKLKGIRRRADLTQDSQSSLGVSRAIRTPPMSWRVNNWYIKY